MTSLDMDPRRPGRIVRCSKLSSVVESDVSAVTETGNDDLMSDYIFMLSISSVAMSYLQNPTPMTMSLQSS